MGYMFRLYRVVFRPSKTTDPILQGSEVHCGIPNAYIVLCKHIYVCVCVSDKVKFGPTSGHESSDRQYSYSCPFSLTTALYVVVVDRYRQY